MGVYIDMEMPPDGGYTVCITHDSNCCVHWVFQNQDTLEFLKHGAVAEVPEPHGRLGDLDELHNHLNEWYLTHEHGFSETEKIYIRAMLSGVKDSPTIIEAEEAE